MGPLGRWDRPQCVENLNHEPLGSSAGSPLCLVPILNAAGLTLRLLTSQETLVSPRSGRRTAESGSPIPIPPVSPRLASKAGPSSPRGVCSHCRSPERTSQNPHLSQPSLGSRDQLLLDGTTPQPVLGRLGGSARPGKFSLLASQCHDQREIVTISDATGFRKMDFPILLFSIKQGFTEDDTWRLSKAQ